MCTHMFVKAKPREVKIFDHGLAFFGKANVPNEALGIRLHLYRGAVPGVGPAGHGEWTPAFKSHSVSNEDLPQARSAL